MSNETKRDVFDEVVAIYEAYLDDALEQAKDPHPDASAKRGADKFQTRYSSALPDDLPVIPKAVSEYIQERKSAHESLAFTLTARWVPKEVIDWMCMVAGDSDTELSQIEYVKQQDIFARAWVLCVWKVEETGEIVKLEEEK